MSQSRNNPVAHMAKNAEFMRLFPAQVMKVVRPWQHGDAPGLVNENYSC